MSYGGSGNGGVTAATGNGGNTYAQGGQTSAQQGGASSSNTNVGGSSTATGGKAATGGATTTTSSTGGATGNGGATGSGGTTTVGTGGTTTVSNGGTTTVSNGGTTTAANGGATTTPTGTTVTFASGKAVGAMLGYGFVALGSKDTVTSPTCGTALTPITSTTPCAAGPNWSSTTALCVTGSIPINSPADYTGNWGISVGVNATDPATGGIGQTFASVAITITGTPTSGLRAMIHRKGDTDAVSYCVEGYTSGTVKALTSFTTACYDTAAPGTAITAADIPNIDKISIQVSSSTTAAITVSNLCITGITFS